jgi:hypothetical protein
MTSPHAAFTKVTAAAASGNQDAQAALDALTAAAGQLEDGEPTGSEAGRAEARRRFGTAGDA